jgi:hypothetical protein
MTIVYKNCEDIRVYFICVGELFKSFQRRDPLGILHPYSCECSCCSFRVAGNELYSYNIEMPRKNKK